MTFLRHGVWNLVTISKAFDIFKCHLVPIVIQGGFFSAYRRISADQYKSGEKVDQYVGGYAFYKHPKLPKKGQKQSFSTPAIHCQNPPCYMIMFFFLDSKKEILTQNRQFIVNSLFLFHVFVRFEGETVGMAEFTEEMDDLFFWLDEVENLLNAPLQPLNRDFLQHLSDKLKVGTQWICPAGYLLQFILEFFVPWILTCV